MPLWKRRQRAAVGGTGGTRAERSAAESHLRAFATSRLFVEAYVEPSTTVTATTIVLIAHDGEWTRRAMGSRDEAFELAKKLDIPVYDVNQTGYPNRMREWTARQRTVDKRRTDAAGNPEYDPGG